MAGRSSEKRIGFIPEFEPIGCSRARPLSGRAGKTRILVVHAFPHSKFMLPAVKFAQDQRQILAINLRKPDVAQAALRSCYPNDSS